MRGQKNIQFVLKLLLPSSLDTRILLCRRLAIIEGKIHGRAIARERPAEDTILSLTEIMDYSHSIICEPNLKSEIRETKLISEQLN